MVLNALQQEFVDIAVDWFHNSSSTLLQLAGYAGTGKSVVISEILRRLDLTQDEVLPMAFTGQACTIMRKRGFKNACTCHSGLFNMIKTPITDIKGNVKIDKQFNTPMYKISFVPKDYRSNANVKLIILDEAWMIPKSFRKYIDDTGIKVIAAGDPGQLPPISQDPGYLVDGDVFFLTELMRQSELSPIVYLANRARNGLPIEPGMYGNDVLVIYDDELDNRILSNAGIVLCAHNTTRELFIDTIRHQILGINNPTPMLGERVICRKNNWEREIDGIPLVNGLTGTVISPPDIGRFDGITLGLDFQPDMTDAPFLDLKINYEYITSNYKRRQELKMIPYIQGDFFEYAYASTIHLAQGSEYYSGIYIEEPTRSDTQNALNYTAITRFKNKMIYVKKRPLSWKVNYM